MTDAVTATLPAKVPDYVPVSDSAGGVQISVLNGDPWAAFRQPPQAASSATEQTPDTADGAMGGDPWGAYRQPPKDAPTDHTPAGEGKTFSTGGAAAMGATDALTFGLMPTLSGLDAAGEGTTPNEDQSTAGALAMGAPEAAGIPALTDAMAGLVKLLKGDPQSKATYDAARKASLADQANAQAQHPYAYTGGQVGGALLGLPSLGAGATLFARLLAAAGNGALNTGLYNAGSAISQGDNPATVAKNAAEGVGTGAAFGGVGSAGVEGLGAGAARLLAVIRGARDVDAEAGRRVANAVASDFDRTGGFPIDPEAVTAAQAAGMPRAIVDLGGERTLALARSAANTSPDARGALNELAQDRFENQSPRVAGFIRSITGNPDVAADTEALQTAARLANKPAYLRAYAAGDRGVWSPELERLAGTPAVTDAARGAVERGQNRAAVDGFGAFRPGLTVTDDGRLIFNKGPRGVPTYPNLQFWDYTQRELRDAANAAQRAGRKEEAGALFGLHRQLLNELDNQVPQFAQARRGAASFFSADNALDAGRGFVMSNASIPQARAALGRMNPAERELFARGFASDLADKIERTSDRRSVINSIFLNNPAARTKVEMALGRPRARQLEALLRAETVTDGLRRALGNSTTARQLAEMGLAGAGVAGFEWLKEGEVNPAHAIAGAVAMGMLHHGAKVIDERVARRVGELLASDDVGQLAKGVQIVTRNPALFNALRRLTGAGARVAASNIGARKSLAIGDAFAGFGAGAGEHTPGDVTDDRTFMPAP